MTWSAFPPDVTDPDSRLRILWIDDRAEITTFDTCGAAADRLVNIVVAGTPKDVWRLLNDSEMSDQCRSGFDVYITDFRLVDSAEQRDQPKATLPQRSSGKVDPDDVALGLNAPSAGFLMGVLFAFHFPDRPSVVLPYSAFADEFGPTWGLVHHFLPKAVVIADPNQVTKVETATPAVMEAASKEFRETLLARALAREIVIEASAVYRALSRSQDELVANSTPLTILTQRTARTLMLGTLFLDSNIMLRGIERKVVMGFLDRIPALAEHHLTARALAKEYIEAAESERSISLYNARYSDLDQGRLGGSLPMPPHKDWLGVQSDDRRSTEERRNALLIILVYIYARHILPLELLEGIEEQIDDSITLREAIRRLKEEHHLNAFETVSRGLDLFVAEEQLDLNASLELAMDEFSSSDSPAVDKRLRLERLLQRYVNPGPDDAGIIAAKIPAEGRIGKGLQRLLEKSGSTPGRVSKKLQGIFENRRTFDYATLEVALAYAKVTLPPKAPRPGWLEPLTDPEEAPIQTP